MNKLNVLKIFGVVVFISFPFIAFYAGMEYQKNTGKLPLYTVTPPIDQPLLSPTNPPVETGGEQACIEYGGKWLAEYNECEGVRATQCEELGGTFDECASACRHDPNAEFCIMMCVPVCKL